MVCDSIPIHDRPLADKGLTSFRCRGRFGYIMLGAKDIAGAWSEARRSTDQPRDLEVWNGEKYVPATE